jgi:hypothetical protein
MSHSTVDFDRSEPQATPVAIAVGLSTVFLVGLFIFASFLYTSTLSMELNAKENVDMPAELRKHRLAESETLAKFGYIDRRSGLVKLPIELAMKSVQVQYSK